MPSSAGQVSSIRITFLVRTDHTIMSGHSFVDKISGGNVIWSWSKSTRSFQSAAPWSKEGGKTGFGHLVSLAPALTKLIVVKDWAVSFFTFQASTSGFRAVFRWSNTESCLQVYLLVSNATMQFVKIWCNVPLAFWHNWQRYEFSITQSWVAGVRGFSPSWSTQKEQI